MERVHFQAGLSSAKRIVKLLGASALFAGTILLTRGSLLAQELTLLHAFKGPPDGLGAVAAPIKDKEGNLYSTTSEGGVNDWGTVYKIAANGEETVLHSFVGGSDGTTPISGLIIDSHGNLYGTTTTGGGSGCFNGYGCGIVYELSPTKQGWKETILYAFQGGSDGAFPGYGTLAHDADGNLYGTAMYGGTNSWPSGGGVVFKLAHSAMGWQQQVVHAFGIDSQTDGQTPYGGVILDSHGNIYGTTYAGGSLCCGTVFEVKPDGSESVLYNFDIGSGGFDPESGLVRDKAGNLFGTTAFGGDPNCQCGTVFRLDSQGNEAVLHTFIGYPSDGAGGGFGTLALDGKGTLWGTTYYGGNSASCEDNGQPIGCGTIYKLLPNGDQKVVLNFSYSQTGSEVSAGVTLETPDYLYATGFLGGPVGGGTLFKLSK